MAANKARRIWQEIKQQYQGGLISFQEYIIPDQKYGWKEGETIMKEVLAAIASAIIVLYMAISIIQAI